MSPGERLGAYCKARKIYPDAAVKMLRFNNATTGSGKPFTPERWAELTGNGPPITIEEGRFVATMLGINHDQLVCILTGANERPMLDDSPAVGFGDTLRHARKQANLSQVELSAKSGIAQAYISVVERKKKAPGPEILLKLATGLGIEWEKLMPSYIVEDYRTKHAAFFAARASDDAKLLEDLADVL